LCHDIEQVDKYISYIGAHELDPLINENFETIHEAGIMKGHLVVILQTCINEFSDNAYVEKYLCGLQVSYEKSYCNHGAMIKNYIGNYFERGKHAN
jgi:hypothetical protein